MEHQDYWMQTSVSKDETNLKKTLWAAILKKCEGGTVAAVRSTGKAQNATKEVQWNEVVQALIKDQDRDTNTPPTFFSVQYFSYFYVYNISDLSKHNKR